MRPALTTFPLPASVLAALLAAAPHAFAGSIGFRTDAEVTAGPGIDVAVKLAHTGDEEAQDVSVRAELLDRRVDGARIPAMRPGQEESWSFHLFDEVPRGVYAVVLRTRYSDSNGYPFETVSTAMAAVDVKPAPRVAGSLDLPRLAADGEATARLTVKKPAQRSGDFDVRIVVPAGLEAKPERLALEFDAEGRASAEFRVRNLKLLEGTTVNIFGFVSGTHEGAPQTDTIRGSVRIAGSTPKISSPMFYQAAAALFVVLGLLEALAWRKARRSAST